MSEFSASYHLKTSDRTKVVDLIKDSENKGYVFEETNGWVTFLIDGPAFNINESVLSCNPGIIVHYIFAEDHGWEFRVFNKDELIFEYKCDWTDEIIIEKELFDVSIIKELIASQGNSISDIEELFDLSDFEFEEPPAYILATKLGLVHFEWLSVDNIEDRLDEVLVVE
jgi:hypothetical protein